MENFSVNFMFENDGEDEFYEEEKEKLSVEECEKIVLSENFLLEQIELVKTILEDDKVQSSNENNRQPVTPFNPTEEEEKVIMNNLRNAFERGKKRRLVMREILEENNKNLRTLFDKEDIDKETFTVEDIKKIGECYLNIAVIYQDIGKYIESRSQALIGLSYVERINLNEISNKTTIKLLLTKLLIQISSGYSGTQELKNAYYFGKKALELSPDSSSANAEYGRVLSNWKKKEYATLEYLNKAVELAEKNEEKEILPFVRRSWILRDHGDVFLSMRDLESAKKIIQYHSEKENYFIPHESLVHSYMGVNHLRCGRGKMSFVDSTLSILLEPRRAANFNNRGNSLKVLQLYKLGLTDMDYAMNLVSFSMPLHLKNRGHLYFLLEDWDNSFCDFDKSIEECDGKDKFTKVSPITYIYRGILLRKMGKLRRAEEDFTTYIHITSVPKNVLEKKEIVVDRESEKDLNFLLNLPQTAALGLQNRGTCRHLGDFKGLIIDLLVLYVLKSNAEFFVKMRDTDSKFFKRWVEICKRGVAFFSDKIGEYFICKPSERTELMKKNLGVYYRFRGYCYKFLEDFDNSVKDLIRSESLIAAKERYDFVLDEFSELGNIKKIVLKQSNIEMNVFVHFLV